VPLPGGSYPESLPHTVPDHTVPIASSPPSAKAESLPLADFYSGQQPDILAASVVDYCSGVLNFQTNEKPRPLDSSFKGPQIECSPQYNKVQVLRQRGAMLIAPWIP
jgi:hypothetical protein